MTTGFAHIHPLKQCLFQRIQRSQVSAFLVDKEEIGSVGASGMQSRFFENTVAEVMAKQEVIQNWHSEEHWQIPRCFPPMYRQRLIRTSQAL